MPKNFLLFLGGLFAGVLLLGSILLLWANFPEGAEKREEVGLESALELVRQDRIRELKITEDRLELDSKEGSKLRAMLDASDATRDQIYAAVAGTETKVILEHRSASVFLLLILNVLPFMLFAMSIVATGILVIVAFRHFGSGLK
ncbi:MAG TPA: hypothetical protein DEP46_03825 [Blastocatellia bacterium]|nr:hypothetical protein [Blastocatellia bacterium]